MVITTLRDLTRSFLRFREGQIVKPMENWKTHRKPWLWICLAGLYSAWHWDLTMPRRENGFTGSSTLSK